MNIQDALSCLSTAKTVLIHSQSDIQKAITQIDQAVVDLTTVTPIPPPVVTLPGLISTGSLPPPSSGTYAYNSFILPLTPGSKYIDPVFNTTIRRVSRDHGHDDIYARNMWWSADEKKYLHRTSEVSGKADNWDVIDVATGAITHTGIPFGYYAFDGGFDPVNPNVLYYLTQDRGDGRGEIHQITLLANGQWSDTVPFVAPSLLYKLGGSINWLDASGRYMLVRYGNEPSVYVYDRQNIQLGPYQNPITGQNYIDVGAYLGLTPDGQYVVGYDGRKVGYSNAGQGVSWKINHTNRTVAPTPTVFWSLCGDHGAFASASNGRNYMITYDCYSQAGLWRVDITNNALNLNEPSQQTLPNNKLLLALPTWNDFGHISAVARGTLQDWIFVSAEDVTDTGNVATWRPYRQEIMAINILTGEVRRLAHHRSRMSGDYYAQSRLSASWGGAYVAFSSNYNVAGVVDIYAISFGALT